MQTPGNMARKQYTPTKIRLWRKHRGLTLEKLASRVETLSEGAITITPSALSLLERGQSAYTQGKLELLARALDTTAYALLAVDPRREGEVIDLVRILEQRGERDIAMRVLRGMVGQ